jgi:L-fucose isomerase-like protein
MQGGKLIPKVGFICLSHDFCLAKGKVTREWAIHYLKPLGMDLYHPSIPMVRTAEEASQIAREIRGKRLDASLVLYCGWAAEEVSLNLGRQLPDHPLMLLCELGDPGLISPSGLTSGAACLSRVGKDFFFQMGSFSKGQMAAEVKTFARAAAARQRLKGTQIAIVGPPIPEIAKMTSLSRKDLAKFGVQLKQLSLEKLVKKARSLSEKAAKRKSENVLKELGLSLPTGNEMKTVLKSLTYYLALKEMVQENQIQAIGVRCWPEFFSPEIDDAICLALALLSDEGIPGSCENDIPGALSMLIGQILTGQPSYNGDYLVGDGASNSITLWHCGAAATRLADNRKKVQLKRHWATDKGTVAEFVLKPGRMTLHKIASSPPDGHKMLVTRGKALRSKLLRNGNCVTVQLDPPLDRFHEVCVKQGIEHHYILSYGDIAKELAYFNEMVGVQSLIL